MKLRLPNKLIAAIVAAASPVLFSTLSTATLGAAAIATLGQQAAGEDIDITTNTNWAWDSTEHSDDTVTISNNKTLQIDNGLGTAAGGASAGDTSTVAASFIVNGGSTLSVWGWSTNASTVRTTETADKVTIASDITLNDNATLKSADGSYVFSGVLKVNGTAQFLSTWNKGYVIENLQGDSNAVLRLTRGVSDGNDTWFVLNKENSFAGKIQMEAPPNWQNYFLIVTNANALHNAEVNTGTANNRFALGVRDNTIRALSGAGVVTRHSSSLGAVTLNVTGEIGGTDKTFSGTLDSNITLKLGADARQILDGSTIIGAVNNTNGGALSLRGNLAGSGSVTSSQTYVDGMVNAGSVAVNLSGTVTMNQNDMAAYQVVNDEAEGYTVSSDDGENGYRTWENTSVYLVKSTNATLADGTTLEGHTLSKDAQGISANGFAYTTSEYYVKTTVDATTVAAHDYVVSPDGVLKITASNTSVDSATLKAGAMLQFNNGGTNYIKGVSIGTLNVAGNAVVNNGTESSMYVWGSNFTVGHLNGSGDLNLNFGADLTTWNGGCPSAIKLTGEGDFSGTLTYDNSFRSTKQWTAFQHSAFVEITHADALKNGVLQLIGNHRDNFTDYVALAMNAGTVNLAGLIGNGYARVYSGTMPDGPQQGVPAVSDTRRTLAINAAAGKAYTYSGSVSANVNLAMSGSGAQTFDGDMSAFNGSINNNGGSLILKGAGGMNISSITSISGGMTFGDASDEHTPFAATITGDWLLGTNGGRSADITIAKGAVVTANTVKASWGFSKFTVDGVLNASDLILSTGGEQYNVSGKGTINTTKLELGNIGYYTISLNRINIGSGGITDNNGGARSRKFDGTTLGALADWTSAQNYELANTVTFDTANAETTVNDGSGHTITLTGVLSGSGSLVKEGAGTLKLSGNNTFTGGTDVQAGTLVVSDGSSSTLSNRMSISEGAELKLTMGAGTYTIRGNVSGEGDMTIFSINGNRTYNFTGDLSEWTGNLRQLAGSGSMTLNFSGTTDLNANIYNEASASNCFMDVNVKSSMTVNGAIGKAGATAPVRNLTVGADESAEMTASFSKAIVLSEGLTVNTGATASFTNDVTVGTNLKVNNGATASFGAGHSLTAEHAYAYNGGTLNVAGTTTITALHMEGGTIEVKGGRLTATNMWSNNTSSSLVIDSGTTATVTSNVQFGSKGSEIAIQGTGEFTGAGMVVTKRNGAADDVDATIVHNTGTTAASFSRNSGDYTISHAQVEIKANDSDMMGNLLTDSALINNSGRDINVTNAANTLVGVDAEGGAITVQNAANSAGTLKSIVANGGNVTIQGLGESATVNLTELTIAGSKTVSAYTGTPTAEQIAAAQNGSNTAVEATLAISNGTLTAGSGAKLNAHLSLGNNTTLDIADATVGGAGLTMGSTLTIANGAKVKLSDNIISGLNSLTVGSGLTLFSGVDSFSIGGAAYSEANTYTASDYFKLAGVNTPSDFVIKYGPGIAALSDGTNQAGQSIFIWREMPEPATSTLSLLALAALAARRKRK